MMPVLQRPQPCSPRETPARRPADERPQLHCSQLTPWSRRGPPPQQQETRQPQSLSRQVCPELPPQLSPACKRRHAVPRSRRPPSFLACSFDQLLGQRGPCCAHEYLAPRDTHPTRRQRPVQRFGRRPGTEFLTKPPFCFSHAAFLWLPSRLRVLGCPFHAPVRPFQPCAVWPPAPPRALLCPSHAPAQLFQPPPRPTPALPVLQPCSAYATPFLCLAAALWIRPCAARR